MVASRAVPAPTTPPPTTSTSSGRSGVVARSVASVSARCAGPIRASPPVVVVISLRPSPVPSGPAQRSPVGATRTSTFWNSLMSE
ncbi:hypothetical protein ACFFX0_08970 [Citricoccus parietis]|uniref:Uncharacterized protein n=1 Tax=Citricoccus parietis TaxID=592307 RepID=A0ABV5FXG1_9MICC